MSQQDGTGLPTTQYDQHRRESVVLLIARAVGGDVGIELLGAIVRDAWRQCRRRPLAVIAGALLVGGLPDLRPI